MLSTKQLTRKIAGIGKRNATLNSDIQSALLNIAAHAYVHGDVTASTQLLNVCAGKDRKALCIFLRDHCFVNIKSDGTVSLNKQARKQADFESGDAVIESLMVEAPNWFDSAITTEQAAKALDPVARIAALTKRIAKGETEVEFNLSDLHSAFNDLEIALIAHRESQARIGAIQ